MCRTIYVLHTQRALYWAVTSNNATNSIEQDSTLSAETILVERCAGCIKSTSHSPIGQGKLQCATSPPRAWVLTASSIHSSARPSSSKQHTLEVFHTDFSFAHTHTANMDEIAPEYDVVVLGTGGTTPPDCRGGTQLTMSRSHRMRAFRVTRGAFVEYQRANSAQCPQCQGQEGPPHRPQ